MKKITLSILVLLTLTCAVFAQGKAKKNPEQKAEDQTQKWTKILSLSPEQIPQVKGVFLDRAEKLQAIKLKYSSGSDKKAKDQERQVVKAEANNSLKNILTPAQYDTYLKEKEKKKKEKKQKKGKIEKSEKSEGTKED